MSSQARQTPTTWCKTRGWADKASIAARCGTPASFSAPPRRRLAINVTQSARARRETHIGTWLPEPVDIEADLAHSAERAEALDRAVLVLLEHVSPIDRAAYVLREAFDHPYRQISKVLAISEANDRRLDSAEDRAIPPATQRSASTAAEAGLRRSA